MELKNKGQLIIAGLDIGNIKDIPQRTLEALNSSDFIVAEHAAIMMNNLDRIGIKYNGKMYNFLPELFDREERIDLICNKIQDGETVLLITGEGMPLIHDPGYEIVERARRLRLPVTVIPGPSAPIAALAMSGIDSWRFTFESDVPNDKDERIKSFTKILSRDKTTIYFEKDWQLLNSLQDLKNVLGGNRAIAVCINLTMKDELMFRGNVDNAIKYFTENPRFNPQEEANKIELVVAHYNENSN